MKSRKKKRLNRKRKVFLICLVLIVFAIYLFNLKVKNIIITGNKIINDSDIIEKLNINNKSKLYSLNLKKIKKEIMSLDLVYKVKMKRNILGNLYIEVVEEKVLFYYKYKQLFITASKKEIKDNNFYGYPILINFTPDEILNKFIKKLSHIDKSILMMISEIEYFPYKSKDDIVIDDSRFKLYMNDGNIVIIDNENLKNLNDYIKIYSSLGMDEKKGTLYLDTITKDNIYFKTYEEEVTTEKEE